MRLEHIQTVDAEMHHESLKMAATWLIEDNPEKSREYVLQALPFAKEIRAACEARDARKRKARPPKKPPEEKK